MKKIVFLIVFLLLCTNLQAAENKLIITDVRIDLYGQIINEGVVIDVEEMTISFLNNTLDFPQMGIDLFTEDFNKNKWELFLSFDVDGTKMFGIRNKLKPVDQTPSTARR